ncbi:Fatty acyl-CoA reductase 1 [Seminavis robusta]|uniref:Fatty acyl-CoA reductase n=1 Tax=Seminavis robusta TaxID=568900 RepID=A0A9N8H0Q4_9STRA|nr:Fatty acyl-CoA reductase 1 [Seminavis robusta]|eukprot:Sro25_g016820.1 Fatty acyl-CoA reductase 1 (1007) ;mRNA; f:43514-46534
MGSSSDTAAAAGSPAASRSMWKGVLATLVVALAIPNGLFSSILPPALIIGLFLSTFAFLGFLIAFVNFYIGKDLRKCSPLNEHLAYVNEETQSSECIKDLDRVASPEGLSQLWKTEIQNKNATCKVLLTGVTGYVGRAFLFQLLREISEAERSDEGEDQPPPLDHKVFVMARPKARKNLSAQQRLAKMKRDPMFSAVQEQWDNVIVAVECGDLQEENCGMTEETLITLADSNLTHVVHCAADVNFNRPLAESAGINISPALQLQGLAATWPSCQRFVHCSTAFVNPGSGSPDAPMAEELFPLGKYDPKQLYESMRGNQRLALEAKAELHFPNNYVFTKCVAEHLVVRYNKRSELRIVRPAIVGPAWVLPSPGWNGDKPSTITALFLLLGTRVLRFSPLTDQPTAMVPVDVVAVGILDAMIAASAEPKPDNPLFPLTIRNLTWSHKSPNKFISGMQLAKQCIPVCVLKHLFTATEAAVTFALIDASSNYPFLYHFLHRVFNLGPLKLLQFVCWTARKLGIRSVLEQVPVVKLLNFSDMLTLYRPYVSRPYFFESSMDVPPSLNQSQYCICLFTATHAFWSTLFPGTIEELSELELMPKGRFDLWWSLTLPCGSFKNRLIGYLACKIIRATYESSEVNFVTLFHAGRTLLKLEATMKEQKHCVVLAPTHRSLMDYILAKYIAFSMVGLGIDVPSIYADHEFNDPILLQRIDVTKQRFDRHATLAAFLEGKPSPDGRLQKPRTQFLKALVESRGDHDYTFIPVCIDYDRVDNHDKIMKVATRETSKLGLLEMFKLYWKIRACGKRPQSFGDVRISFGVPTSLDTNSDVDAVAAHIQSEHLRLTTVSDLQLSAAERHLQIPTYTLGTALEQLGVNICKNKTEEEANPEALLPTTTPDDLWRLHLQWMPRLAPFLVDSHPKWAQWIVGGAKMDVAAAGETICSEEIEEVLRILTMKLDTAESLVEQATAALKSDVEEVTVESLVEAVKSRYPDDSISQSPLLNAAASFALE